jgi:hypothetical protein
VPRHAPGIPSSPHGLERIAPYLPLTPNSPPGFRELHIPLRVTIHAAAAVLTLSNNHHALPTPIPPPVCTGSPCLGPKPCPCRSTTSQAARGCV